MTFLSLSSTRVAVLLGACVVLLGICVISGCKAREQTAGLAQASDADPAQTNAASVTPPIDLSAAVGDRDSQNAAPQQPPRLRVTPGYKQARWEMTRRELKAAVKSTVAGGKLADDFDDNRGDCLNYQLRDGRFLRFEFCDKKLCVVQLTLNRGSLGTAAEIEEYARTLIQKYGPPDSFKRGIRGSEGIPLLRFNWSDGVTRVALELEDSDKLKLDATAGADAARIAVGMRAMGADISHLLISYESIALLRERGAAEAAQDQARREDVQRADEKAKRATAKQAKDDL